MGHLDIYHQVFPIKIKGEDFLITLKWYRGSNRYNNGATRYKRKYLMRWIINTASKVKRYDKRFR